MGWPEKRLSCLDSVWNCSQDPDYVDEARSTMSWKRAASQIALIVSRLPCVLRGIYPSDTRTEHARTSINNATAYRKDYLSSVHNGGSHSVCQGNICGNKASAL